MNPEYQALIDEIEEQLLQSVGVEPSNKAEGKIVYTAGEHFTYHVEISDPFQGGITVYEEYEGVKTEAAKFSTYIEGQDSAITAYLISMGMFG